MRLWRPGWHPGAVVTPPSWLPNWKGFRIREQKWKLFISVNSVFERFIELLKIKNKV
jgi:predicted DNA-binding transcriptional regulator